MHTIWKPRRLRSFRLMATFKKKRFHPLLAPLPFSSPLSSLHLPHSSPCSSCHTPLAASSWPPRSLPPLLPTSRRISQRALVPHRSCLAATPRTLSTLPLSGRAATTGPSRMASRKAGSCSLRSSTMRSLRRVPMTPRLFTVRWAHLLSAFHESPLMFSFHTLRPLA